MIGGFLPAASMAAPMMPQQAPEPFVWGRGGQRRTMEDIARQRALADEMSYVGMDFSPVGHWTQGAARLANAIGGKVQGNRADKAEESLRDESMAVTRALLEGQANPLEVMADPYLDENARSVAAALYEQSNARREPTPIERMMLARGIAEGSPEWNEILDAALRNETDPFVNFSGPGFGFAGRQSALMSALGGGDQVSGSGGDAPDTLPPDFFDKPTMENTPAPELGANGMPARLSAMQYQVVVDQMGADRAEAWRARHGIQVEGR